MSECPCRYCNARHANCHGECKKYLEWNDAREAYRNELFKKKRLEFLGSKGK